TVRTRCRQARCRGPPAKQRAGDHARSVLRIVRDEAYGGTPGGPSQHGPIPPQSDRRNHGERSGAWPDAVVIPVGTHGRATAATRERSTEVYLGGAGQHPTAKIRDLTLSQDPVPCGLAIGELHQDLVHLDTAAIRMVIGERWKLDELAEDCAVDGVFELMLTAKPLKVIGGVC